MRSRAMQSSHWEVLLMYAIVSTKQSQVVEAYLAALTYLGDERVVHVYLHEVEVLTIDEVR